ncbi:MAG: class I SAM-dependent methyltransferase [Anaerolineales bacterium]|nr:MAG: class I SAM-dependent methyltransferase [Anaerolineales bacterium]
MSDPSSTLRTQLDGLMRQYYEDYYRKDLSLVDWRERIENRMDEERTFAEPNIRKVEEWMGVNFAGQRVLVVGAGTGAESVVLHQRGAEVHGIEPYDKAIQILALKAELHNIPPQCFQQAVAEQIPHPDESFDFVYCYTVLEHVQDVEKTIDEMLRVCKTGGLVYIQTPEYRFPYEGHYKITRLPFSPRWLTALQLLLNGRSPAFLRTVNFVTAPQLNRLFFARNVLTMRIELNWLKMWAPVRQANKLTYWFTKTFGIGRDQYIFLRKLGAE